MESEDLPDSKVSADSSIDPDTVDQIARMDLADELERKQEEEDTQRETTASTAETGPSRMPSLFHLPIGRSRSGSPIYLQRSGSGEYLSAGRKHSGS